MKQSVSALMSAFLILFLSYSVQAEGLPANPWQNRPAENMKIEPQGNDVVNQASEAVTDIWNKVRDTKEFKQWQMPEQSETQDSKSDEMKNKADMLKMLANLNRVGYKLPNNYQKTLRNMPKKSDSSLSDAYEKTLREWKIKYGKVKNNSLNILDNSYRRTLSTIKSSTGVDLNRAINDTVNTFK